ncbi:hypothetical protein FB45DRAFT_1059331 [Roridomyces roridus]|uniref:Uncharacterized protein n=1 Tax=Roridomyces roridus TaxID=1738132 RepID=A0AAD7BRC5_9AGAR|nr:hypothetical protein FB45DRAFT_1059331 [Roridomyces roridus]
MPGSARKLAEAVYATRMSLPLAAQRSANPACRIRGVFAFERSWVGTTLTRRDNSFGRIDATITRQLRDVYAPTARCLHGNCASCAATERGVAELGTFAAPPCVRSRHCTDKTRPSAPPRLGFLDSSRRNALPPGTMRNGWKFGLPRALFALNVELDFPMDITNISYIERVIL